MKEHEQAREIKAAFEDPDDILLDTLKARVRQMNSGQLLAFWRWIMLEFVQRCKEEHSIAVRRTKKEP